MSREAEDGKEFAVPAPRPGAGRRILIGLGLAALALGLGLPALLRWATAPSDQERAAEVTRQMALLRSALDAHLVRFQTSPALGPLEGAPGYQTARIPGFTHRDPYADAQDQPLAVAPWGEADWLLLSVGPNGRFETDPTALPPAGDLEGLLPFSYDPTNGPGSGGDLWLPVRIAIP